MRRLANRSIRYGFKVHRRGRMVRRGGVLVMVASGAGLAAKAVPTFIATHGASTGLPPDLFEKAQQANRVVRRVTPWGPHIDRLSAGLRGRMSAAVTRRFPKGGRVWKAAERASSWGARHKLGTRAWRLGKAGAAIATLGAAGMGVGNYLIRSGFRGHQVRHRMKRLWRKVW